MPVKPLNVFTYFDVQRFKQYSPQDAANWTVMDAPTGKRKMALYPAMGRSVVTNNAGEILLQFNGRIRAIFKSIDFMYVVVGGSVIQVDKNFNQYYLPANPDFDSGGPVWFAYLPVITGPNTIPTQQQNVFCMFTCGGKCFVVQEATTSPMLVTITDPNAPPFALYVAAFGNRFVVSSKGSTQFQLTQLNCVDDTGTFDPATLFTIPNGSGTAVFAQEAGIIQQLAVLHNQLYIFCDFTTGIWANLPSQVGSGDTLEVFPWKKNTSYDWDYGIADPNSVDVDFGMICWLAQNRNGLVLFMKSSGNQPEPFSTQAVNTLIQQSADNFPAPFLDVDSIGFLYQYEDTVFYRISAGPKDTFGDDFLVQSAASLEYNFNTQTWKRCIEVDGDRNLIQDHIFFQRKHIVSVLGETTLYMMAGNIYTNQISDDTEDTGYRTDPMRYELVTPIISEDDYSEFLTKYIQVDFVWGEISVVDFGEVYVEPSIELYISDDGGISFYPADNLEFSKIGQYQWMMRWYQGGPSRNRAYQLIATSNYPIVILGGVQLTTRASGGAN